MGEYFSAFYSKAINGIAFTTIKRQKKLNNTLMTGLHFRFDEKYS